MYMVLDSAHKTRFQNTVCC